MGARHTRPILAPAQKAGLPALLDGFGGDQVDHHIFLAIRGRDGGILVAVDQVAGLRPRLHAPEVQPTERAGRIEVNLITELLRF